ncbi:MAG: tetratricopeptide repeat protein [Bacteroidota bacterium]
MAKHKKNIPAPAPKPVEPTEVITETTATGFSLFNKPWLAPLILAGLAFLVYGSSVQNGFVFFDDDKAILYNNALRNPSLGKFFTGQNLGMYAPITWLAYWLGSAFSGQEAWGYHLISLLLHALNTVLVFRALSNLTGRNWPAFAAAVLFAVHPIQAEAVCWAAALSTVLFAFFYLLSFNLYIRWVKSERPTLALYGLSLGAFLLADLSKSAAVTLPLLLLATDFYLFNKLERKHWLSKIPYLIGSLIFGLYTFSTRAQEGHDIETASAVFNAVDRFFMVCQTLLFYPFKLLIPSGFSVAYPFVKIDGTWNWTYLAAPVLLAGLAFLVWKKGRKQPDLLLGLALYFLPLTVMLPFRTVGSFELRSDRYAYISCVGIFFLLALLLEKLKPELQRIILGLLAVVLGFLTLNQTRVWSEGVSLFKNCVNKTPESSLCQCNLAYNELISLDFAGAEEHYTQALKYDPNTIESYNGRGQAYMQLRKIPEALSDFNNAISNGISTPKLFLNRGKCYVALNRFQEAIPDLVKSIELEPKSPEAYFFLAAAKEKTGDANGAIDAYGQAATLKPDYVEALVNRGLLLMTNARFDEAIESYTKAIQANPNVEMIWNNRAYAFYKKGDPGSGLADADKAIMVNKKYARAYQTRAIIYQALGRPEKAQEDFQTAAQLGFK